VVLVDRVVGVHLDVFEETVDEHVDGTGDAVAAVAGSASGASRRVSGPSSTSGSIRCYALGSMCSLGRTTGVAMTINILERHPPPILTKVRLRWWASVCSLLHGNRACATSPGVPSRRSMGRAGR